MRTASPAKHRRIRRASGVSRAVLSSVLVSAILLLAFVALRGGHSGRLREKISEPDAQVEAQSGGSGGQREIQKTSRAAEDGSGIKDKTPEVEFPQGRPGRMDGDGTSSAVSRAETTSLKDDSARQTLEGSLLRGENNNDGRLTSEGMVAEEGRPDEGPQGREENNNNGDLHSDSEADASWKERPQRPDESVSNEADDATDGQQDTAMLTTKDEDEVKFQDIATSEEDTKSGEESEHGAESEEDDEEDSIQEARDTSKAQEISDSDEQQGSRREMASGIEAMQSSEKAERINFQDGDSHIFQRHETTESHAQDGDGHDGATEAGNTGEAEDVADVKGRGEGDPALNGPDDDQVRLHDRSYDGGEAEESSVDEGRTDHKASEDAEEHGKDVTEEAFKEEHADGLGEKQDGESTEDDASETQQEQVASSFARDASGHDVGGLPKGPHLRGSVGNHIDAIGDGHSAEEQEVGHHSGSSEARSAEVGIGDDSVATGDSATESFAKRKKKKKSKKQKKQKRSKVTVCPLHYNESSVPTSLPQLASPPPFTLSYVSSEIPSSETWIHRFAGHQTWQEREDSFHLDRGRGADGKRVHCGFVNIAGLTGSSQDDFFHVAEKDLTYLATCRIAVVSALFGNFDQVHLPQRSLMSEASKRDVCFVLFLDEASLEGIRQDKLHMSRDRHVGLWRTILVKNMPYADNRVNGKIPKMLSHRLLPNAEYSIWVDSKLRLYADPLFILQQFLVGPGAEFAISQHYDRRCVWEEVARNKFLKKFNETILDQQLEAYRLEGLKPFDPNDTQRLLASNVPEGSFFMRAHTPLSNLFTCLWFNEVDRFSSRDQIGFAYVYHKLVWSNPGSPRLRINMFRDCDKRAMVKLFHHREEEKLLKRKKKLQQQQEQDQISKSNDEQ